MQLPSSALAELLEIRAPIIKLTSAWSAAVLTSLWHSWQTFPWSTLAQFLAACYSALLIWEILSKKRQKAKDTTNGSEQNLS